MTAEIVSDAGHVDRLLPALLNGTLAPGERDEALQHLDRCAACRTELAAWEAIRTATRAYSDIALPTSDARPPGAHRRRLASSSRETGMTSFSSVPFPSRPLLDVPRLPALPGKPARRAWPLAQLATAALLLLTLAASYVALPRGPLSIDRPPTAGILTGVAPARLAFAGLRDDIVLLQGIFPVLPKYASWAGIERTTLAPGADWPLGTRNDEGEGPWLYLVESGALTVQTDGPIEIARAGDSRPTTVPAGSTVVLQPGDRGFAPSGVTSRWRNEGSSPVQVLDAGITTDSPIGLYRPASITHTGLIDEGLVSPPSAPVAVTARRITLAAGSTMPASAIPGLQMLLVESGRLEALPAAADGTPGTPLPITMAKRSDSFFKPDTLFRNVGAEPTTLLVMTILPADPTLRLPPAAPATPVPSATADGITPLMRATFDRMPNNPTVVGVARTNYRPGAADAAGSAGGPVLIHVERGEIGIAGDGPVLVGKAAKPSGTIDPPAPARNPSLGPGMWAAVSPEVSFSIRNVGLTDAEVSATFIVSETASLSGAPDAPGTSGNLLGTLSGDDMPPAPVTIDVGRTTLAPDASLPAVPADARRLVVAETGNGVGMGMDGSARNLTNAPLTVDVVTIAPVGAAGTPAP